ncbi:MAG: hypothetical protein Q9226_007346, partial [Calogaya cf. arnoldii]
GTTTLDNGPFSLSVIYYGHGNLFFNSSHAANIVSRPIADPELCPDSFQDIFDTCVLDQNFRGGWVMSGGTNRSVTNHVYPANPLPQEEEEESQSSPIESLGDSPGTHVPHSTLNDAGISTTGDRAPTTTTSSSSSIDASSSVERSSTDADNSGIEGATTGHDGDQPPSTTTSSTSSTSVSNSQASSVPLPPGGTVIYTTIGSQVYSETFFPTTLSKFTTLASTLTTSTLGSESSSVPLVIGPGGVAWVPLNEPSGPDLSPPSILPTNPNAPSQPTTTGSKNGQQSTSSGSTSSNGGGPSIRPSITAGGPSQTTPPGTTGGDEGITTTEGDLPIITTSYDPEASTISSIGPEITGNTAIRTSDDHHGLGFFPFWKGGPKCFIICPPGIDGGGIILWGMDKPGVSEYSSPLPAFLPALRLVKWASDTSTVSQIGDRISAWDTCTTCARSIV